MTSRLRACRCGVPPTARRENPALQVVEIPATLAVGADCGLAVAPGVDAHAFALFVVSGAGRRILANQGLAAPNLP